MVLEGCDMVLGESLDNVGTLNGHVYDLRLWSRSLGATDVTMRLKVRNMDSLAILPYLCGCVCLSQAFLNALSNNIIYSGRLASFCFTLVFPFGCQLADAVGTSFFTWCIPMSVVTHSGRRCLSRGRPDLPSTSPSRRAREH